MVGQACTPFPSTPSVVLVIESLMKLFSKLTRLKVPEKENDFDPYYEWIIHQYMQLIHNTSSRIHVISKHIHKHLHLDSKIGVENFYVVDKTEMCDIEDHSK